MIRLSSVLRVFATILGSVWLQRSCSRSDSSTAMFRLKMEQFLQSLVMRYLGGCCDGVACMFAVRWQWSDMPLVVVVMCVISDG